MAIEGARILIVEDNPMNMELFREVLEICGYVVEGVSSGEKALDAVTKMGPDLILLDMGLPVMDGLTILRMLQADPQMASIPVVVASAHAQNIDEEVALAAGCFAYLRKPVRMDTLVSTVQNALGEE